MQKCCRARQATDDDKIGRVRIACWITEVTNTHSECVILLLSHGNKGMANAPQPYDCTYIACHVFPLSVSCISGPVSTALVRLSSLL